MGWLRSSGESQNSLFPDSSELDDLCELLALSEVGAALGLELKSRPEIVKDLNTFKIDFLVFKKLKKKTPFADLFNLMHKREKYLYRSFSHPSSESCEYQFIHVSSVDASASKRSLT